MFKTLFRTSSHSKHETDQRFQKGAISDLPAGAFRFVAVDVETANRDAGSICQIGCAFVNNTGDILVSSQMIDPRTHFDAGNIAIHGIRPEDVCGHPTFDEVLANLQPVLEKNNLIQHSPFDSRAIRLTCENNGLVAPKLEWHDSVRIARKAWPELKGNGGHGLASLKTFLDLDFQHHDAGEDARAAAEVVLKAEKHTGLSFLELAAPAGRKKAWQPNVKMPGHTQGTLFGQIAVFTGALSMSRTEAATIAARSGIETKSGMSRKVTLLIVGDQDLSLMATGQLKSSKHRKAEELIAQGCDIRIMAETEFLKLVHRA